MRILLVNYRYFISGGPEKYMFGIKHVLEEKGHEVIPFSVDYDKNEKNPYSKYFVSPIGNKNDTYYHEVKKTPRTVLQLLSRSIYSIEVEHAVRKEIRDVKPDIVYIIHIVNKLSPSVIHGAKKERIPVIMRLSDYHLLCPSFHLLRESNPCEDCITKGYSCCLKYRCVQGSFFASLVRVFAMKFHNFFKLYDEVDSFVTPTRFLKEKIETNGFENRRIEWIPTFCDGHENVESSIGDFGLYFGRIAEEKGVLYLIKAYEKLPNNKLIIVGDDSTEEALVLKKYVNIHGLNNICFTGYKSGKELSDIIANSRFVLVPSIWYENLPNVVLESFNYCKPVIASNIGSMVEIVKNNVNGFLFEPKNVDQLVTCILKMKNSDTVKELGLNAKRTVEIDYSSQKHYDKLIALFDDIIKKNKC